MKWIKVLPVAGLFLTFLFSLSGCGGGSESSSQTPGSKITLQLKETAPSNTVVSKINVTMVVPNNVSPKFSNGTTIADGAVVPTGIFNGASVSNLIYTPATSTEYATIKFTLISNNPNGVVCASGFNSIVVFNFQVLKPFESIEAAAAMFATATTYDEIYDASNNKVSGIEVWTTTN